MMGNGWGMGVGGWIAMTIFWVGLLVLIVWLVSRAFSPGRSLDQPWHETPEQVLDRRFAAGEIDETSYHSMRDTLQSTRTPRSNQQ